MAWDVRVVADSVSPSGHRLTSIEATYPLIIHNEVLTHRAFSRNAASNRAIPSSKIIEQVMSDPFIPETWPKRSKSMAPTEILGGFESSRSGGEWLRARDFAVIAAVELTDLGVHKEIANRLLAPFQWITVLLTATDWTNFFELRCHEDAEQHIRKLAMMIMEARASSTPREIGPGEWHLPYVPPFEVALLRVPENAKKLSVARCARLSYAGQRVSHEVERDLELYQQLIDARPIHFSPFEHVAAPSGAGRTCANFRGWQSLRYGMERSDAA